MHEPAVVSAVGSAGIPVGSEGPQEVVYGHPCCTLGQKAKAKDDF